VVNRRPGNRSPNDAERLITNGGGPQRNRELALRQLGGGPATPAAAQVERIITATTAGSARVRLSTSSTDGSYPEYDRAFEGNADFSRGRARLEQTWPRDQAHRQLVLIGPRLYERASPEEKVWTLHASENDERVLTADGFGLMALALGAADVIAEGAVNGHERLVVRVVNSVLFDDLSPADVFGGITTVAMREPLLATFVLDDDGRAIQYSIQSETQPRARASRRRFELELRDFGVSVAIDEPKQFRLRVQRRGILGRLMRYMGDSARR
jgi:hypothetical protein